MPSSMLHLTAGRPATSLTAGACLCGLVLTLGLSGCDRRSESNPGSTPAAVGSGKTSSGRSDAGMPSSGVEVSTPSAPDSRGGGSSGSAGVGPIPDTSGAPSSGSSSPGASRAGPAPSTAGAPAERGRVEVIAPQVTNNGGVPASALGQAGSTSGNTNSMPASTTGSR